MEPLNKRSMGDPCKRTIIHGNTLQQSAAPVQPIYSERRFTEIRQETAQERRCIDIYNSPT